MSVASVTVESCSCARGTAASRPLPHERILGRAVVVRRGIGPVVTVASTVRVIGIACALGIIHSIRFIRTVISLTVGPWSLETPGATGAARQTHQRTPATHHPTHARNTPPHSVGTRVELGRIFCKPGCNFGRTVVFGISNSSCRRRRGSARVHTRSSAAGRPWNSEMTERTVGTEHPAADGRPTAPRVRSLRIDQRAASFEVVRNPRCRATTVVLAIARSVEPNSR